MIANSELYELKVYEEAGIAMAVQNGQKRHGKWF
jgi:hypothetical protein